MVMRYVASGLVWRPVSIPAPGGLVWTQRLEEIITPWIGTPYMPGQQAPGPKGGVDCVRFVAAVLDALYDRPKTPINTLPPDAALHSQASAMMAMLSLLQLYQPNDPVEDNSCEPGDVVITGHRGGGPGHAMIVGTRKNTLCHAAGVDVHWTGLAFVQDYQVVHRVYRMCDREGAMRRVPPR